MRYDFTPLTLTKYVKFDNANDFLEYRATVRTIGASQMAQWVKNSPAMRETQETRVRFVGQENLLEEGTATHSSILVWRIPWTRRAWQATVCRVAKRRQD